MCLAVIFGLEGLGGAAIPQGLVAGRMLLCELGEVDLALVNLVAQLVKALRPVRAVGGQVMEGLEGKVDVLGNIRGVSGRNSPPATKGRRRRSC